MNKIRAFRVVRVHLIPVLILLALVETSAADEAPLKLLKQLSLSSKEISRMLRGEIVAKKLHTKDKREIAVLGVMLLNVPSVATVEAARDIKTFKEGKEILSLGKFESFHPDELRDLTLDDDDLEALGKCRVSDCDAKLPGAWIEKLSRERDEQKRIQLLRVLLADYARDYSSRGNKAVLDYEDAKHPVRAQKEFESILEHSPYLKTLAPDFYEYLKEYPEKQLDGIENFIYWSREKFGFKPVINLTHVSTYRWSNQDLSGYLIASRQIFADHYSDASLGLTILIDRPLQEGKSAGSYLVYINRSRIDMLGGFLSSFRRALTLPRIRGGLEVHMKKMRTRVEERKDKPPKRAWAILPYLVSSANEGGSRRYVETGRIKQPYLALKFVASSSTKSVACCLQPA